MVSFPGEMKRYVIQLYIPSAGCTSVMQLRLKCRINLYLFRDEQSQSGLCIRDRGLAVANSAVIENSRNLERLVQMMEVNKEWNRCWILAQCNACIVENEPIGGHVPMGRISR